MSDIPEVQEALRGLLRNLEEVRAQRLARLDTIPLSRTPRVRGEVWGLDIAISAVKRRLG